MASIQDVAKKAKVGVGTVSRVLNGNGYVAGDTKERVQLAIKELDYTPNELARNLLHKKTNIIGVIVPNISNPYFASLVNAIEQILREYGYKTMLCNTVGEKTNEREYLDMLQRNMVDGILTCTHTLSYEHYQSIKRPMVSFDTIYIKGSIPLVTVNHKKGGALAAEALLQAGCKKLLQFKDAEVRPFPFFHRHDEFEKAVTEAGMECRNYIMEWNRFESHYFEKAVQECFLKNSDVDGIFGTDLLVMYYLKFARRQGISIPEKLRAVAYDGTYVLDLAYPSITAIVQPIDELAKTGVETLLELIEGKSLQTDYIQLDVSLRQGESTEKNKESKEVFQ